MKGTIFAAGLATLAIIAGGPVSAQLVAGMQGQGPSPEKEQSIQKEYKQENMGPEMVRKVQQALKKEGYNVGPVDGKMGNQTSSALAKFQEDMGIKATGNLNGKTLFALGVEPKDRRQQQGERGGQQQ